LLYYFVFDTSTPAYIFIIKHEIFNIHFVNLLLYHLILIP